VPDVDEMVDAKVAQRMEGVQVFEVLVGDVQPPRPQAGRLLRAFRMTVKMGLVLLAGV